MMASARFFLISMHLHWTLLRARHTLCVWRHGAEKCKGRGSKQQGRRWSREMQRGRFQATRSTMPHCHRRPKLEALQRRRGSPAREPAGAEQHKRCGVEEGPDQLGQPGQLLVLPAHRLQLWPVGPGLGCEEHRRRQVRRRRDRERSPLHGKDLAVQLALADGLPGLDSNGRVGS